MIKTYYLLTKPGIIFGNLLTTAAGFFLASRGLPDYILLFSTIFGLGLVIASACVLNNYIDRHLDKKMSRTKKRALVTGKISISRALLFALVLGLSGYYVLFTYTNNLVLLTAFIGYSVYIVVYGICKRATVYGTLVGSIAGAIPPVVGYVAVSNQIDAGAGILFLLLLFWQMPHFYAIAMYRFEDYFAARLPVLPVVRGVNRTKQEILFYILAFVGTALLLPLFGYTGTLYSIVVLLLGLYWVYMAYGGVKNKTQTVEFDKTWARGVFVYSLIVVTLLSLLMSVDVVKN